MAVRDGRVTFVPNRPPPRRWSAFWKYSQTLPDSFAEWLTDPLIRADIRADLERKVERITVGKAGKSGRWAERPRVPKVGRDAKPSLRRDGTPVMVAVGESRPAPVSKRVAITWRKGVEQKVTADDLAWVAKERAEGR